ncbi:hypothetical protein HUT19_03230 [Streptomyces sp. NA02950]|uniref:hypothetical protein n=1 Tax=Streptomyces sp. NA02950 TaxID=2742137 RepID=UPI001591C80A|nr:hypothetical protein [Streptomyces sp. NA02950]QKV90873.1 hypothetical protein HUT19_03230 [Streptomyces sp. NA02950]
MRFGIERGEVRGDIAIDMIVAMADWLVEWIQDALVAEELNPGLFHHPGRAGGTTAARMDQFADNGTGSRRPGRARGSPPPRVHATHRAMRGGTDGIAELTAPALLVRAVQGRRLWVPGV